MYRISSAVVLVTLISIFVSCSATESTRESETGPVTQEETPYPSWYQQQTIVDTDSVLTAYTIAIASDSSSSVSKAIAWGRTELASYVAASMEDVRADVAESATGGGDLQDPVFIYVLAQNDAVQKIANTINTEVETVEGYGSHRSYAEVQITKDQLLESLEADLDGYKKAWNTLKESQAFKEFAR